MTKKTIEATYHLQVGGNDESTWELMADGAQLVARAASVAGCDAPEDREERVLWLEALALLDELGEARGWLAVVSFYEARRADLGAHDLALLTMAGAVIRARDDLGSEATDKKVGKAEVGGIVMLRSALEWFDPVAAVGDALALDPAAWRDHLRAETASAAHQETLAQRAEYPNARTPASRR